MRVVGTVAHEHLARRLSDYLAKEGIANVCEANFDAQTGYMAYEIWICDEDRIEKASLLFQEFQANPSNPKFDPPPPVSLPADEGERLPKEAEPVLHRFKTYLTQFLIALCSLLFFLNTLQEIPLRQEGFFEKGFLPTPLQSRLMYDLPLSFETAAQLVQKAEIGNGEQPRFSAGERAEIETLIQRPYWKGGYFWAAAKIKGEDVAAGEGPLFRKIRQGEIWRLATPCLLHQDLLHILFNMLWLWYLGRPIEQRIGPSRIFLLSLAAAAVSNTLQYLMSGPFFIGYSGIVTALAGFTWMRERIAPWEGYPLNRPTFLFLAFFIGAIFVLQVLSFTIELFAGYRFAPNIANTAHIGGALIGAFLGKLRFFAQRVKS